MLALKEFQPYFVEAWHATAPGVTVGSIACGYLVTQYMTGDFSLESALKTTQVVAGLFSVIALSVIWPIAEYKYQLLNNQANRRLLGEEFLPYFTHALRGTACNVPLQSIIWGGIAYLISWCITGDSSSESALKIATVVTGLFSTITLFGALYVAKYNYQHRPAVAVAAIQNMIRNDMPQLRVRAGLEQKPAAEQDYLAVIKDKYSNLLTKLFEDEQLVGFLDCSNALDPAERIANGREAIVTADPSVYVVLSNYLQLREVEAKGIYCPREMVERFTDLAKARERFQNLEFEQKKILTQKVLRGSDYEVSDEVVKDSYKDISKLAQYWQNAYTFVSLPSR